MGKIDEEKKQKYVDWIEKRKPEEATLDEMISAKVNIGEKKGREEEKEEKYKE